MHSSRAALTASADDEAALHLRDLIEAASSPRSSPNRVLLPSLRRTAGMRHGSNNGHASDSDDMPDADAARLDDDDASSSDDSDDWRRFAPSHRHGDARAYASESDSDGGPRRKRSRLLPEVDGQGRVSDFGKVVLEFIFNREPYPTTEVREQLSQELGLEMVKVGNWFCNRRQRLKKTLERQGKRTLKPPQRKRKSKLTEASPASIAAAKRTVAEAVAAAKSRWDARVAAAATADRTLGPGALAASTSSLGDTGSGSGSGSERMRGRSISGLSSGSTSSGASSSRRGTTMRKGDRHRRRSRSARTSSDEGGDSGGSGNVSTSGDVHGHGHGHGHGGDDGSTGTRSSIVSLPGASASAGSPYARSGLALHALSSSATATVSGLQAESPPLGERMDAEVPATWLGSIRTMQDTISYLVAETQSLRSDLDEARVRLAVVQREQRQQSTVMAATSTLAGSVPGASGSTINDDDGNSTDEDVAGSDSNGGSSDNTGSVASMITGASTDSRTVPTTAHAVAPPAAVSAPARTGTSCGGELGSPDKTAMSTAGTSATPGAAADGPAAPVVAVSSAVTTDTA